MEYGVLAVLSTTGLIMANLQKLNQFKRNNSCINDANPIKLDVNHHVMMMHIPFKFHEILFIG